MTTAYSVISLSDTKSIYQTLKHQIQTTNNINDLLPMVQPLISMNELKNILINNLDKHYYQKQQKEASQSFNNIIPPRLPIEAAFIRSHTFNEIPSDIIHSTIYGVVYKKGDIDRCELMHLESYIFIPKKL